jgi:hypothetical protein
MSSKSNNLSNPTNPTQRMRNNIKHVTKSSRKKPIKVVKRHHSQTKLKSTFDFPSSNSFSTFNSIPTQSTSSLAQFHPTLRTIVGSKKTLALSFSSTFSQSHRSITTQSSIPQQNNQHLFPLHYEHPYGSDLSRNRMLPTTVQSYDELKNFKVQLPKMYNIGVDITDKHVYNGNGDKKALIYVDQYTNKDYTVDYKFLSEKSNQVANGLKHMGIKKGDKVCVLLSQSIEVAILHAAISKVGAVAVPLSILFGPEALQHRIQASKAKALFLEPSKMEDVIQIVEQMIDLNNVIVTPHLSSISDHDSQLSNNSHNDMKFFNDLKGLTELNPMKKFFTFDDMMQNGAKNYQVEMTSVDDDAIIIFTSGTTGLPKGALHRQSVLLGRFFSLFCNGSSIMFSTTDEYGNSTCFDLNYNHFLV